MTYHILNSNANQYASFYPLKGLFSAFCFYNKHVTSIAKTYENFNVSYWNSVLDVVLGESATPRTRLSAIHGILLLSLAQGI